MAFVSVARMDLVSNRIASWAYKKAKNDLRIRVLAVFGPSGDADIVLSGLEVHRCRVVEDYGYSAAKNAFSCFPHFLTSLSEIGLTAQ